MKAKKLTQLAMLTGLALIIFVVELQIPNPFPIPGIKLGLANIITVYALYNYRAGEVMMIVFSRIFLAAVFGGNMIALLYSFFGSVLCLIGMLLLKRIIDEKHIWIASVFGAILHNIGQIAVAAVINGIRCACLSAVSAGVRLSCRCFYRRMLAAHNKKNEK